MSYEIPELTPEQEFEALKKMWEDYSEYFNDFIYTDLSGVLKNALDFGFENPVCFSIFIALVVILTFAFVKSAILALRV